jgi:O-antigen/teichoic acid export membrane protein
MEDCCKDCGKHKKRKSKLKKWFSYSLYIIIGSIVNWTLVIQIYNNYLLKQE